MTTARDNSRSHREGSGAVEHINMGSLQRIADATELMAKEHAKLVAERDFYRDQAKRFHMQMDEMARSNAALRGVITKLKGRAS